MKPFIKKTKKFQKLQYIRKKNKIGSELFYSPDYFDERMQWTDFWFLGENPIVYSATISTSLYMYREEVHSKAYDLSLKIDDTDEFIWLDTDNTEYKKLEIKQDNFSSKTGMRRMDWVDKKEQELLKQENIYVPTYEVKLDYSYLYGIGLHVIIDVPVITEEVVRKFINEWNKKEYHGSKQVTFPYNNIKDRSWIGMASNALKDF